MRRTKRGQSALTLRLPEDVSSVVQRLVSTTGWSAVKALSFLVSAGGNALLEKGAKIEGYRRLLSAAVEHHEAEMDAKNKLSLTSLKLREARKALVPAKGR